VNRFNYILFLLIVVAFGIFFSDFDFFKNLQGKSRVILQSVSISLIKFGIQGDYFFQTVGEIRNLATDNRNQKVKIAELENKITRLNEVKRENESLKIELGVKVSPGISELTPLKIIGRSPSSYNQTIYLNGGQSEGVQKDQPIFSRGFLVGKIESSEKHSSQAILITNHRFVAPVILSESRALGLLRGGLKGVIIEQIRADIEIGLDESILTAGLLDFPQNIPIGKVQSVLSQKSEIFQTISVMLPFNLNELETVYIAKQ